MSITNLDPQTVNRITQNMQGIEDRIEASGVSKDILTALFEPLSALAKIPAVFLARADKVEEKALASAACPDFAVMFGNLPPAERAKAVASREAQYRADAGRRARDQYARGFLSERVRPAFGSTENIPTRAERLQALGEEIATALQAARDHVVNRLAREGSGTALDDLMSANVATMQLVTMMRRLVEPVSFADLCVRHEAMTEGGEDKAKLAAFRAAAEQKAYEYNSARSLPGGARQPSGSTTDQRDALKLLNEIHAARLAEVDPSLPAAVEALDAMQDAAEVLLGASMIVYRRPIDSEDWPVPEAWATRANINPMRLAAATMVAENADRDARLREAYRADPKGSSWRSY